MLTPCQEPVPYSRCSGAGNFRSGREVSELEDARGCGGEGRQEPDSILQPEYDGGFSAGLGKFLLRRTIETCL